MIFEDLFYVIVANISMESVYLDYNTILCFRTCVNNFKHGFCSYHLKRKIGKVYRKTKQKHSLYNEGIVCNTEKFVKINWYCRLNN